MKGGGLRSTLDALQSKVKAIKYNRCSPALARLFSRCSPFFLSRSPRPPESERTKEGYARRSTHNRAKTKQSSTTDAALLWQVSSVAAVPSFSPGLPALQSQPSQPRQPLFFFLVVSVFVSVFDSSFFGSSFLAGSGSFFFLNGLNFSSSFLRLSTSVLAPVWSSTFLACS